MRVEMILPDRSVQTVETSWKLHHEVTVRHPEHGHEWTGKTWFRLTGVDEPFTVPQRD